MSERRESQTKTHTKGWKGRERHKDDCVMLDTREDDIIIPCVNCIWFFQWFFIFSVMGLTGAGKSAVW